MLLSTLLISCGKNENSKVFTIGTGNIFPPFAYTLDGSTLVGFDIEIAKIIAQNYGEKYEIVPMNFEDLIPAIQNGDIDMMICATTITEERKKIIDYSNPYYETSQALIIRKDRINEFESITTKEELGHSKSLAAEASAIGATIAKSLAGGRRVFEGTFDAILAELEKGEVDAIVMDGDIARITITRHDDLMILPTIKFPSEYYGIVVQKGNKTLLSSINRTLNDLVVSGEYNRLVEQHVNAYLAK